MLLEILQRAHRAVAVDTSYHRTASEGSNTKGAALEFVDAAVGLICTPHQKEKEVTVRGCELIEGPK